MYDIDTKNLHTVCNLLEMRAVQEGIIIEYIDMSEFSEDEYYQNEHEPDHEKHAETARSDGKVLLLEKDVIKAGNIEGRIYDIMHLAFGHMVQWSQNSEKLLLSREQAWSIGYRNHEKSPDRVVDMMSFYEFEAGMLGVEVLRQEVEKLDVDSSQKERMIQYFIDYVYADQSFIINHYRGNYRNFESFWIFGQDIPPRQKVPRVESFIQRHAVEIGLIREKNNSKQ